MIKKFESYGLNDEGFDLMFLPSGEVLNIKSIWGEVLSSYNFDNKDLNSIAWNTEMKIYTSEDKYYKDILGRLKFKKKYENFDWNEDDFDYEEEEQENDIKVGDNVRLKEIGKYVRSIDDYPNNTRYYSFEFNKYNYFNNIQKVMKIKTRKDGEKVMKIGDKWPWFECSYWKAYD